MKVELTIHASKLKNVAGLGKFFFPRVILSLKSSHSDTHDIGKTEVIKNSLSPNWVKSFVLDYELGTPTKVAIQVRLLEANDTCSIKQLKQSDECDIR